LRRPYSKRASARGLVLNKATIRILEESIHKPKKNHDLDEFLGGWSKEEADAFDTALESMRQVEALDWEPQH
jgi:hypothetical protein